MKALLHWLRVSKLARVLRAESRVELVWMVVLAVLMLVAFVFVGSHSGEERDDWALQYERGVERRMVAEKVERFEEAGSLERLLLVFNYEFTGSFEEDRKLWLRPAEYGPTRFWLIARVNAWLLVLLFLTRPWWLGLAQGRGGRAGQARSRALAGEDDDGGGDGQDLVAGNKVRGGGASGWVRALWWGGFGLILLLGTALRVQRMDLSLYNDEVMNVKRNIVGNYAPLKDGQTQQDLRFFERDWETTFFSNRYGSYPVGFGVLSRLVLDWERERVGGVQGELIEWPLRLPAVVGAMMAMLALGLGLHCSGNSLGALVAMAIWATHPWLVRYGSEGRPYGLMMGLVACLLVSLFFALRSGRWRAWVGMGLAQALALWVTPGALWLVFFLNLVVLMVLVSRLWRGSDGGLDGGSRAAAWGQLLRMAVLTLLSAMVFFQLSGSTLPEFKQALDREELGGIRKLIPAGWWQNQGTLISTGMVANDGMAAFGAAVPDWNRSDMRLDPYVPLNMLRTTVYVVGLLLLASGLVWWRGSADHRRWWLLGVGGLVSTPVAYLVSSSQQSALFTWYVIGQMVLVVLLLGLGAQMASSRRSRGFNLLMGTTVLALLMPTYLLAGLGLAYTPKEDLRGVAQAIGGGVWPNVVSEDEVLRVISFTDADIYDPLARGVGDVRELKQLELQALAEDRTLRFGVGHISAANDNTNAMFAYVSQSSDWVELEYFPGLEELQYSSWAFEYRPRMLPMRLDGVDGGGERAGGAL